jgi:HEAT repeat protein
LEDTSGYVIRTATEIASRWGLTAAAARLRTLARDADSLTRRASLEALRTLGSDEDLGMLLTLFGSDPNRDVRNAAAWAMAALASQRNWRDALAALAVDPIPRHRLFACDLIERFGNDSDRETLQSLLDDPDGHVRKAAGRLLNSPST